MKPARSLVVSFGLIALALAPLPAISAELAVVVNRVVYPGETVDAAALQQVTLRRAVNGGSGFVRDVSEVEGKVAKRTLVPGKLIPVSAVREAYVVEAGTIVTVVYSQGGLTITSQAVPLEPGALGAMVKLRNPDSGKIFSGVVMADGTIRVSG
jgi:flagella basal body P-ring formation protein FlgA